MIIRPLIISNLVLATTFIVPEDLSTWSKQNLQDCLTHPDYQCYGLEANQKLVAYAIFNVADKLEAHLMQVAVMPSERGKGYASQLLQAVLPQLQQETVLLEVRENNTPAIKLYASLGFILIGQRKNYYFVQQTYYNALVYKLSDS